LIPFVCLIIFVLATVVQLWFLVRLWHRQGNTAKVTENKEPVSVIVCARNEAGNLKKYLPLILQQDYPQFEVIVVNDQSTDPTEAVLQEMTLQYPQLRVIHIPATVQKTLPGKKYPLSLGIAAARYEQLVLTDADCQPASDQWLKYIAGIPKKIVPGYGAYRTRAGVLNRFIRWETVHTCMQYVSYASAGKAYMGVGRNLAYPKSLAMQAMHDPQFVSVYSSIPSGDDDLLLMRMAQNASVTACLHPGAHTVSEAPSSWSAWWRQKSRHVSTGKYYASNIKLQLGLYALSHSLYWFFGLVLILMTLNSLSLPGTSLFGAVPVWLLRMATLVFFLRLLLYWINAGAWYRQLQEKKLVLFYPLGDLGWAIYNVFLSPYILWKNRKAWK
jgi:cellulose synthase/poly-beta-1,6-N-acetylglucosamine synthase-like glycosyltransferase